MEILTGLAEGQVLQRREACGASVDLTGTSSKNGPLYATVLQQGMPLDAWKRREVGNVCEGRFSCNLHNIPSGGPYELKLEAADTEANIREFFVGDVWVLAGQSNMEGAGRLPGFVAPHPLVRSFSLRREWRLAKEPLHVSAESPDACHNGGQQISRETAENWRLRAAVGAGVGIHFGKEMCARTRVPQGLICSAKGNSMLTQWSFTNNTKQSLYKSMIAAVRATGQPVAGVLWYQGESDTSNETEPLYTETMKNLVATARLDLDQPRLPWVIVQLARVFREGDGALWNRVQEQQRRLPEVIDNLQVVAAIDLSLEDEIHISRESLPLLGNRLARAAHRLACGNTQEPAPPQLDAVQWTVSREESDTPKCGIDVSFANVEGGLKSDGEPSGFYLQDGEGKEIPCIFRTELHENFVRLHLTRRPAGDICIGYGRGFAPRCNIMDGRGMAIPVFAPHPIQHDGTVLPFLTEWQAGPVLKVEGEIDTLVCPDVFTWPSKKYPTSFINEHQAWQGQDGFAFFASSFRMEEARSVRFLMGYDGPFRLWLDGEPLFCNPRGINPCIEDESGKVAQVSEGIHKVVVAMNINHGRAWGFFFRMEYLPHQCIESS